MNHKNLIYFFTLVLLLNFHSFSQGMIYDEYGNAISESSMDSESDDEIVDEPTESDGEASELDY